MGPCGLVSLFFVILFFTLCACSNYDYKDLIGGKVIYEGPIESYIENPQQDYVDHLASLAQVYVNSPGVKTVSLSKSSLAYLDYLHKRVVSNNELVLDPSLTPTFYVIQHKAPFYFSLPKAQYFFSTGLIQKYFENEEMLISALTYEILRSHRAIYEKRFIIPIGHIFTERLLSLTRVPLDVKFELNKLAFFTIKRAGFDSSAYLNWLQVQNKHTLDFTLQHGDSRNISREEFMFKNFIVRQQIKDHENKSIVPKDEENSSQEFYRLISEIRRVALR